jgi:nucleotide-binding universal stress UspA family protein
MKKVLIALDYDITAQKVADTGLSLAKTMNAEIVLLHVIANATYYSALEYSPITGFLGYMDMSSSQLNSIEGLKDASQIYLEKLKHHMGEKSIMTVVKEGDSADSILAAAKEFHCEIIVMGSHSRNWLENIVMGSVTEKVLRHTSLPMFIVPVKNRD